MISENLYREVLLVPAEAGATKLCIASGYASASMAHRHLREDAMKGSGVKVELVYGMAGVDGVSQVDNATFKGLQTSGLFQCHYRIDRPVIHSKVYVWLTGNKPVRAFVGSANYTQRGFLAPQEQQETMTEADSQLAFRFFQEALRGSLEMNHEDVEHNVRLYTPEHRHRQSEDCVTLSLLTRDGRVGARSGLNWGQRPGRDPNEAYLRVPTSIAQTGFFPSRATQFSVLTDDGFTFVAVVAQDNDKAIETPDGNHILGEYFRLRIGVPLGDKVHPNHLERYGRADVEFCKLDDETYHMDFAVQD